jgi:hypothetical protein
MLNPRMQKDIRRANHLLAAGDHRNAGILFENSALKALDLNFVYPAPLLFMQAAHAFALGGDVFHSNEVALRGLEILAAQERRTLLSFELTRYIETLKTIGESIEASPINALLKYSSMIQDLNQENDAATGRALPEKCPYCGGALGADQLNSSQKAVICQYCGSAIWTRPDTR